MDKKSGWTLTEQEAAEIEETARKAKEERQKKHLEDCLRIFEQLEEMTVLPEPDEENPELYNGPLHNKDHYFNSFKIETKIPLVDLLKLLEKK